MQPEAAIKEALRLHPPLIILMREAKVLQIVEGTNQIQRLVISRHLLG